MLETVKKRITLTKGDDGSVWLRPRYKDKSIYTVQEGDRAFFRINATKSVVEIECNVNVDANKIVVPFVPNDTKDLAPGIYRYEAELITSWGMHYTFLANETFILGAEIEKHISNANSNGNYGNNIPSVDGEIEDEPVVDGDIQPTNPSLDYETLNHLPKINGNTLKGDMSNEDLGIPTALADMTDDEEHRVVTDEQISDWNNKVEDDNYVHTDNNYDDTAKNAVDALGTASTYDVPESGNASTSQVVKGDDSRLRDNRDPNPHTHQKADITDFPTNVSAFNNDSGFITNTVNNLANYYLKAETYTKSEVEQLIAAIKQGKFEIVAELPASGDANVIYLVPKSTAQTSNSYDEYVYINNAWELIGDTEIDLSGYVTDDELTTALQSYLTTSAFNTAIANYYTKTETDNLLGNKVDKVAGKGLSTNDYDNTAKGIVDGVTSALNDKVDKVQGKGLSTNDYDNTAKGIVDGVTSALADKVDKVNGKGLSTEDYTTAEKSKLAGISANAKKVASSSTNGHIEIDDVDTTVYDDTAVTTAIENIEDELSTDSATVEGNPINFSTKSAQNAKSTILSVKPIQDLHGYDKPWVGGAGKNKLSGIEQGGFDTMGGDATSSVRVRSEDFISVSNSTSYVVSSPSSVQINVFEFTAPNTTNIGSSGWKNLPYSFTTSATTNYIRIMIRFESDNDITPSDVVNMQLEQGSTSTSWSPYTNICPITGRTQVGIEGCGKNLWNTGDSLSEWFPTSVDGINIVQNDISLEVTATINSATSSIIVSNYDHSLGWWWMSKEIKLAKNTDYKLVNFVNMKIVGFTSLAANTVGTSLTITNGVFNSGDYAYWVISIYPNNLNISNTMVLFATETDSTFEPYTQSNDLTISFGQTVYGGQVVVEKGELVVDRETIDLGSLDWVADDFYKTSSLASVIKIGTAQNPYVGLISSILQENSVSNIYNNEDGIGVRYSTVPGEIRLRYTGMPTVLSDFVASVTGQTLCYPLATPITIQLTPNAVNLLKGANYITTDGDNITLTYRDGSVATLEDVKLASEDLEKQIADAQILTDTVTGDKYKLVITNGVLDIQQISN